MNKPKYKLLTDTCIRTVGNLKKALKDVPDNYSTSCMGAEFLVCLDTENEIMYMDEPSYIYGEEMLDDEDAEW